MNIEVKNKLESVMEKYGISQNEAARDVGYSSPVLSAYRKGTYAGVVDKLEDAIMCWVSRVEQAHARKRVPITETDDLRQIVNAIAMAHNEQDLALIIADAGAGKSTAAKWYAARNQRTTVLINVVSGMNRKMLVQDIAKQLGIDTVKVQQNTLIQNVSTALKDRDMVVILDEADYLKADALEFSRRLVYDLGESGLVLIGLPRLKGMIQGLRNDHRQLESRIGVYLHMGGLTKRDASTLAKTVWPDVDKDIVDAIYDVSKTDIRQYCKIIERTQMTMALNKRSDPDLDCVASASQLIIRRQWR
jgi:DNA transposition AAA+ family ATPase